MVNKNVLLFQNRGSPPTAIVVFSNILCEERTTTTLFNSLSVIRHSSWHTEEILKKIAARSAVIIATSASNLCFATKTTNQFVFFLIKSNQSKMSIIIGALDKLSMASREYCRLHQL